MRNPDRKLHLKRRTFAQHRFDPDAATMHFYDLSGYCQTQPSAALGLRVGAIDLMKLLEDALLLFDGDAWPRVGHTDRKVAIRDIRGDSHFTLICELNCIAHKVEQDLGEALFVAHADREARGDVGLEPKLLGFGKRFG